MRSRLPASRVVTTTGTHRLFLSVATGFTERLRGLMFKPSLPHEAGLLLQRCTCIHTCFMLHEIDVLYVDAAGKVVKCVAALAPWRISFGNDAVGVRQRAVHVIELRAGTIERLGIAPGSTVGHPAFAVAGRSASAPTLASGHKANSASTPAQVAKRARGSAMTEFAVVAPITTLIGLAILQYGLLFFARNQYNHAAFMAARAGSTGNADIAQIRQAYARALVPLYGGGVTSAGLASSSGRAQQELDQHVVIEMRNPTAESFADWNDELLQQTEGGGQHRVIPNGGLAMKKAAIVPAASGQSIHDANLLKLRITHGYKPQVPVIGAMYARYLAWLDSGTSKTNSDLIAQGLIPVVVQVTMHMQSDAIEGPTISAPGMGNAGAPSGPGGGAPAAGNPPTCLTALCTEAAAPAMPPVAGSGGEVPVPSTPGAGPDQPGQGGGDAGGDGGGTEPGGICLAPAQGSGGVAPPI